MPNEIEYTTPWYLPRRSKYIEINGYTDTAKNQNV